MRENERKEMQILTTREERERRGRTEGMEEKEEERRRRTGSGGDLENDHMVHWDGRISIFG